MEVPWDHSLDSLFVQKTRISSSIKSQFPTQNPSQSKKKKREHNSHILCRKKKRHQDASPTTGRASICRCSGVNFWKSMLPFGGQHKVQRFFLRSSFKSNTIHEDLQPQLLHHICTPAASPESTTRQSSAEKEVGQKHIPWSKWFSRLPSHLLKFAKHVYGKLLVNQKHSLTTCHVMIWEWFIAKALVSSVVLVPQTTLKPRYCLRATSVSKETWEWSPFRKRWCGILNTQMF